MKKKTEENEEELGLPIVLDKKVSFGRATWGKNGPFLLAFTDSLTRDYCECNADDFKNININDVKVHEVPIWECGARTQEEIDKLPKMNLQIQKEKSQKEKEAKKKARADKMKATLASKKKEIKQKRAKKN